MVALLGPRQVGKTTLARLIAGREGTFFDLEDPRVRAAMQNPMLVLEPLRGLVVLDEVQHVPELFNTLRVLADRPRRPAHFLVLGSASPDLLRQSSESLAGRIAYFELEGLNLSDVSAKNLRKLWLRGGFPRSFLARNERESLRWRLEFTRTFAERDLAALGVHLNANTVQRFWSMLAHYHAQIWNGAELARSFGVSEKTVKHYLDILCATFMARRLRPWFTNLGKREVKAPKIYLTDSGLLHCLFNVSSQSDLLGHPKVGASFEGFALSGVTRRLGARADECFFWSIHAGAELDLLVVRGKKRLGFEFKFTESPQVTKSMRSALSTLGLARLDVVHCGPDTFPLDKSIRALALSRMLRDLDPL